MGELKKDELVAIDFKSISHHKKSPCDIYIVLPSGKLIRVNEKGTAINKDIILKCLKSEDVKVYMSKEDYVDYVKSESLRKMEKLGSVLQEDQFINRERRVTSQVAGIKFIRLSLKTFGVTEEVMDLTNNIIDSVLFTFEKIPTLKSILDDISQKGDFFHQKAVTVAYLAVFTLSKTPYDSESNRAVICMASYLHDFLIKDESILTVDFSRSLSHRLVDTPEYKEFVEHAVREAKILADTGEVPLGAINLIKNHHVSLRTNYPSPVLGDNDKALSYVSQIFNVSHDLAIKGINHGFNKKIISGFFFDLSHEINPKYKPIIEYFSYLL